MSARFRDAIRGGVYKYMHLNYLNSKQVHLNEKSTIDGLIQTLTVLSGKRDRKKYLCSTIFLSHKDLSRKGGERALTYIG